MTKVGIVTVTYNSGTVLDDFLASLEASVGTENVLYVVDNASSDDTLEQIDRWAGSTPTVVLAQESNLGVAAGNNVGIAAALADGCDWILLLNNDVLFAPDMVAELVRAAEEGAIDLLSPIIDGTEPADSIWYAGGRIHRWRAMQAKHPGMGGPAADVAVPALAETDYASTCCLLVRPAVFEEAGLMSEEYFVYCDDVDFALRAKATGRAYWLTTRTRMTHKASTLTGGSQSAFGIEWLSRNWVLLARTHCTKAQLLVGTAYMQTWALGRLVLRKDTPREYIARQRAYRKGWRATLPTVPRVRAAVPVG
jgi:GT2 family glycosyltransferase